MIAEFLTGISYANIYHLLVVIPLVTLNESLGTITLEVNALPVHFSWWSQSSSPSIGAFGHRELIIPFDSRCSGRGSSSRAQLEYRH
jgi:hypothetical protein